MIRVVLDTNIIVSALLKPLGPPAQILLLGIEGTLQLCVSGSVFAEYEEVVRRPKFNRNEATVARTLQTIREISVWVRPTTPIRVCPDPDDDIFLACAGAAQADYLVTGNLKHFPPSWAKTQIVAPRDFLETLGRS